MFNVQPLASGAMSGVTTFSLTDHISKLLSHPPSHFVSFPDEPPGGKNVLFLNRLKRYSPGFSLNTALSVEHCAFTGILIIARRYSVTVHVLVASLVKKRWRHVVRKGTRRFLNMSAYIMAAIFPGNSSLFPLSLCPSANYSCLSRDSSSNENPYKQTSLLNLTR